MHHSRQNHSSCIHHLFYSPKSSKIHRCWIVWGKNIHIVIIPSFLAITLLGQSIYHNLISRFHFIPIATWIASSAYELIYSINNPTFEYEPWVAGVLYITALIASMAVNTFVTGMIVFRILKVSGMIKPTSVERTLGSSTAGTKFRHIMFVIIESGMALFAIQLVRVVLSLIPGTVVPLSYIIGLDFVIVVNQMLNVNIIRSTSFVLLITFTLLGHRTNDNFGTGSNGVVLR